MFLTFEKGAESLVPARKTMTSQRPGVAISTCTLHGRRGLGWRHPPPFYFWHLWKTQCCASLLPFHAPASSFFRLFLFYDFHYSSLLVSSLRFSSLLFSFWLFPPVLFHLSLLSEVWLQNFLRLIASFSDTFIMITNGMILQLWLFNAWSYFPDDDIFWMMLIKT